MALTEEEKNSKLAEKDSGPKNHFQNEVLNNLKQKIRRYERTVGVENENRKKEKRAIDPDDPNKRTYWELVKIKAHEMVNSDVHGYNEWQTMMSNMVHGIGMKLAKANYYDPIEFSNLIPYKDELGGIWEMGKDAIRDSKFVNYLENSVRRPFLDDKELPGVGFTVSLDANNHFNVEVTKDGEPMNLEEIVNGQPNPDYELKKHFEVGFTAWAEIQGYELDAQNGTYKDDAGTVLNQTELLKINQDAEKSFLKFATGRYEMPFTGGMRPS
ncbi:MAG: hypothetical protein H0T84_02635 [Tatlockia sp.]|nr:hypothetical protein [Tatlockia sp.]